MGVGVSVFVMNEFPILGIMSANKGKCHCLRWRKAEGPSLAASPAQDAQECWGRIAME